MKHKWEGVTGEYNAMGGGCSSSATQGKNSPEGVRDAEGKYAIPFLIYNTMCILWVMKDLFEGNLVIHNLCLAC